MADCQNVIDHVDSRITALEERIGVFHDSYNHTNSAYLHIVASEIGNVVTITVDGILPVSANDSIIAIGANEKLFPEPAMGELKNATELLPQPIYGDDGSTIGRLFLYRAYMLGTTEHTVSFRIVAKGTTATNRYMRETYQYIKAGLPRGW